MTTPLIDVANVSKKFCRSLKRSLWYGMRDLCGEVLGRRKNGSVLRHNEFWAIRDLSFQLFPGETLGLIGPNGAGKTTILRILNGLINPDQGRVTVRGRMQALIALGAGFNPVLSGRENIYINAAILGIRKAEVDRLFDAIVDFSGIPEFIDAPVQSYSSGMAVRLGFAVAAHLEPDILLVDEVLAVGDEGFQVKCLNKIGELKSRGTAIILVSHNMHTVSTYSDRVLLKGPDTHELFNDVSKGIRAYRRMVHVSIEGGIEKHCSGADGIEFYKVDIPKTDLELGDDFHLRLHYRSTKSFPAMEVDIALRVAGEAGFHYQATNLTFGQHLDLSAGEGWLDVAVRNLRTINTSGWFAVAVWQKGRSELLFWWRIPVHFNMPFRSSGTSLYDTSFVPGASSAKKEGVRLHCVTQRDA